MLANMKAWIIAAVALCLMAVVGSYPAAIACESMSVAVPVADQSRETAQHQQQHRPDQNADCCADADDCLSCCQALVAAVEVDDHGQMPMGLRVMVRFQELAGTSDHPPVPPPKRGGNLLSNNQFIEGESA